MVYHRPAENVTLSRTPKRLQGLAKRQLGRNAARSRYEISPRNQRRFYFWAPRSYRRISNLIRARNRHPAARRTCRVGYGQVFREPTGTRGRRAEERLEVDRRQ